MTQTVDRAKRRFLTLATSVVGGAGAVGVAWPFLSSWQPSARARAMGAPVEADISKLEEGARLTVNWRGRPVWIVRRSKETLADLETLTSSLRDPESEDAEQPEYIKGTSRAINPEFLVMIGQCTHLGCSPLYKPELGSEQMGADWKGGFFCPCHGSKFDLSGRVYKSVPAPTNMPVPPYSFRGDNVVVIGVDPAEEAA